MDEITKKLNDFRDKVDTYDLLVTSKSSKLSEVYKASGDIINLMVEIEIELSIKHDGITESN